MRIAIFSDLHLEFDERPQTMYDELEELLHRTRPGYVQADVVVLAGDIHVGDRGVRWAMRTWLDIPKIYVPGNHEFYGHFDMGSELRRMYAASRLVDVHHSAQHVEPLHLLVDRTVLIGSVRFIGATLWTDFALLDRSLVSMADAAWRINDFRLIHVAEGENQTRELKPIDTAEMHKRSRAFIEAELAKPFAGKTVVVTHHAPSAKSVHPRYAGSLLNPAFASNLDDFIERFQPDLWVHGHVHDSFDYRIGKTRVICNPRGYFHHELNPSFDPALVVEV